MSDFIAPLCRPLTRRLAIFGLPYEAFYGGFVVAGFMVLWRFWWFLPLVALAMVVVRQAYLRDEWGLGSWLIHAQFVVQGKTRWEA